MNAQSGAVDFLEADLPTMSALVENLAKSWALAPSSLVEPPKVTHKQVVIAEERMNLSLHLSCLSLSFVCLTLLSYSPGLRLSTKGCEVDSVCLSLGELDP